MRLRFYLVSLILVAAAFTIVFFSQILVSAETSFRQQCKKPISEFVCYKKDELDDSCSELPNDIKWFNDALANTVVYTSDAMRKNICESDGIVVSKYLKGSPGGAYTETSENKIYISESLLKKIANDDENFIAKRWKSPRSMSDRHISPSINVSISPKTSYMSVAFLLVHEFTHRLENTYLVSPAFHCLPSETHNPRQNASLSKYFQENTRGSICLNELKSDLGIDWFTAIRDSNFVSSYATCNNYEDFAETYAYMDLVKNFGLKLVVQSDENTTYFDLEEHLNDNNMGAKIGTVGQINNIVLGTLNSLDHLQCAGEFADYEAVGANP